MPRHTTKEQRPHIGSQRYTDSEKVLQDAAAKAAGFASTDLWRRHVTVREAEVSARASDVINPLIEQGQQSFVDLARDIASNNRTMIEQGLNDIRAAARSGISPAALAEAVEPVLVDFAQRIGQRTEGQIARGLDAIGVAYIHELKRLHDMIEKINTSVEAQRQELHDFMVALLPEQPAETAAPSPDEIHAMAAKVATRGSNAGRG